MPTKFSDIAKGPNDLLNDDYTTKVSLKCKKNAGPVAVTLETERASGSGALSSKVAGKFAYAGLSFDKVQGTAVGGYVLETSMKPAPGLKISFKGNKKADLGVDYTTGDLYATGVLDAKDMSRFSASACMGVASGVLVGGNATYDLTGKSGISAFNLGASYSSGPLYASVTSANKMASYNVGLLYKVNGDLSVATSSIHTSQSPLDVATIGARYKAAGVGTVKAKVGTNGVLSACLIREIAPKVTLTASGSASASDPTNTFKYGLGIVM